MLMDFNTRLVYFISFLTKIIFCSFCKKDKGGIRYEQEAFTASAHSPWLRWPA